MIDRPSAAPGQNGRAGNWVDESTRWGTGVDRPGGKHHLGKGEARGSNPAYFRCGEGASGSRLLRAQHDGDTSVDQGKQTIDSEPFSLSDRSGAKRTRADLMCAIQPA